MASSRSFFPRKEHPVRGINHMRRKTGDRLVKKALMCVTCVPAEVVVTIALVYTGRGRTQSLLLPQRATTSTRGSIRYLALRLCKTPVPNIDTKKSERILTSLMYIVVLLLKVWVWSGTTPSVSNELYSIAMPGLLPVYITSGPQILRRKK